MVYVPKREIMNEKRVKKFDFCNEKKFYVNEVSFCNGLGNGLQRKWMEDGNKHLEGFVILIIEE